MQLLKTKFHIPDFNLVSNIARKRISELINDTSSIVIISAPAGFGKTTLLSEWVKNCNTNAACLSLEKSENIPALFWSYLITAISSVSDGCGKNALEQLRSSGASSIETILITVINDILKKGEKLSLVLDDYHVIDDKSIHSGIEFLMDHLPSNMRLIISGREAPPLSISKFRVSGKLAEIKSEQLRFNSSEAESLLNQIHGLDLNKKDVISLKNKTEGWVTGLVLAVLSLKEQKNTQTFIDDFTGSHRYILDYLIEEVLSGLGNEIKDFMLSISVLERFCPDLCQMVSENPDTGKFLNIMEKNNLFLIPLDNNREWFRYHHLFREFLLKNLSDTNPCKVKELHEKAFHWFKNNHYEPEAFHHGILAKNYNQAAALLSYKAPELFSQSGGFILKNYIDRLPDRIIRKDPVLCSYKVMLNVLAGNFNTVNHLNQDIFDNNKVIKGFKAFIQGYRYFYQTGEFDKCIKTIKIALKLLPYNHFFVREMAELILSLSLRYSGNIEAAYSQIQKISPNDTIPVIPAITCADILLGMGELRSALLLINKSIEKGKLRYGDNLLSEYGYLYILKASILRERNKIPEALKACRKGLYLTRNNEYIDFVFIGNLEYAKILAADKNFSEADKAIHQSLVAAKANSSWGQFMTAAYKIRIEILKGDLQTAEKLLYEMGDFSLNKIPFYKYHEYLSFCRFCICKKKTKPVHEITDFMIKEDLATKRLARLLECYILKAIAFYLDTNSDKALNTLQKAFEISEKEGHVRLYIDEGENIISLFRLAFKKGCLPDYLKPWIGGKTAKAKETSVLINEFRENFNEREIEILKLMKKGFSNKNIADALFLSVNTVRWYASRIFAKLDVKRRGEAVSCAEKYKLI